MLDLIVGVKLLDKNFVYLQVPSKDGDIDRELLTLAIDQVKINWHEHEKLYVFNGFRKRETVNGIEITESFYPEVKFRIELNLESLDLDELIKEIKLKSKPMSLELYIHQERPQMLDRLRVLLRKIQDMMKFAPSDFINDHYNDEPSLGIRLCVEIDSKDKWSWRYKTDFQYDVYPSTYISDSCIDLGTDPDELLTTLIEGLNI